MSIKLSVIIPAYNEEDRLPPTLHRLIPYCRKLGISFEIVVVDDGSRDKTVCIVEGLAKDYPEIKLVNDGFNRGRTGAMRRGFEVACGEILLEADADGSVADEAIGRFLKEFADDPSLDMILASREVSGAHIALYQPKIRVFLGKGFIYVARFILGIWHVSDFALGFKMFRRAASRLIFDKQREQYLVAESEIVFLADRFGLKYKELPITWTDNADSRISPFREIYRSLIGLFRIRLRGLFGKYGVNSYGRRKDYAVIIILISFLVSAVVFCVMTLSAGRADRNLVRLTGDSVGYVRLSESLYNRNEFTFATSTESYFPNSFRTPGYPLFLTGLYSLFKSWYAVLVAQVLVLSFVPVVLYFLIKPYGEKVAFFASVIYIFSPVRLFYSAQLLTDGLFVLFFLISLVVLERARKVWSVKYMLYCGFVLGCLALIRPVGMFLPIFYVAYLLIVEVLSKKINIKQLFLKIKREYLFKPVFLIIAFLIIVLPWSLRNYHYFSSFNLSVIGSYNLVFYNASEYLKVYPDDKALSLYHDIKKEQGSFSVEESISLRREKAFSQSFRSIIEGQEIKYAFFHLVKTIPFFLNDGWRDIVRLLGQDIVMPNISSAFLKGDLGQIAIVFKNSNINVFLFFVFVIFWAIVSIFWLVFLFKSLWNKQNYFWVFLSAMVLYFALLTGPVSSARYRMPVEGLLLACVVYFVFNSELCKKYFQKSGKS